MLHKTSGIVLSYIRYKESSIICKIFTRELGMKSYLINGVRSQNSKSKIALYQPMTLLEMVVYNKESTGLQRVSEVKLSRANQLIPFDFSRTGIALFMTEVLTRSIFENYQNESLFDFLERSIIELDHRNCSISHFPLVFLIEHAKYLGFAPESAREFLTEHKGQPFRVEEIESAENFIKELIINKYTCHIQVPLSLRRKLMDHLLEFYNQQLENNQTWKSMTILRQLLD